MPHEKVFGHCENLCEVEVVAKENIVETEGETPTENRKKIFNIKGVIDYVAGIISDFYNKTASDNRYFKKAEKIEYSPAAGQEKGIYWKENGYGDKFEIVPDFNGADDNNVLKIKGAVGAQGTDPAFTDLVKIGAKTGNTVFKGNIKVNNGSDVVNKGDFAIITGSMVLNANAAASLEADRADITYKQINYPTGFNKTNCVPIAFGTVRDTMYDNKGYAFHDLMGTKEMSVANLVCAVSKNISLLSDYIQVAISNYNTAQVTYMYKIVLMKV